MRDIISIVLQADPSGMVRGFREAEGASEKFVSGLQSSARALQATGQAWNSFTGSIKRGGQKMLAGGAASSIGIGGATKLASTYQTQLKNVQSLTKATDYSISEQSKSIMELSGRLPQSSANLAEGLYDIASSGFEGSDALKILEASAVSASAGMTSAEVSSKAIVAALNAYGKEASEAADISDIFFQGVNVGVVRFEELASSMGQWIGMAAQVGVSLEEGVAGIATMTLSGIEAQNAATYMSRLLQAFIDPSEAMNAAAQEMGYATPKMLLDAKGMGDALLLLSKNTGGNADQFNELFGSIQAARGAMAITANEGENWNRTAAAITSQTGRAGAAADVYAYQQDTLAVKFQTAKNNMQNLLIGFGEPLLAPLGVILDIFSTLTGAVLKFGQTFSGIASYLGAAGTAFLVIGGAIATFLPHLVAARIAMSAFAAASTLVGASRTGSFLATMGSSLGLLATKFPKITASLVKMRGAMAAIFLTPAMRAGATAMGSALKAWATGELASNILMGGLKKGAVGVGKGAFRFITSGAGVATLGLVTLGLTLKGTIDRMNQLKDAGKEAGNQFVASLDSQSLGGVKTGLDDINKKMSENLSIMEKYGGGMDNTVGSGNYWEGVGMRGGMILESIPLVGMLGDFGDSYGKYTSAKEEQKVLQEAQREFEKRRGDSEQVVTALGAAALGNEMMTVTNTDFLSHLSQTAMNNWISGGMKGESPVGAMKSGQYIFGDMIPQDADFPGAVEMRQQQMELEDLIGLSSTTDMGPLLDQVSGLLGKNKEELSFAVQQGMSATNVSLDDLIDVDKRGDAFAKVRDYLKRAQNMSVVENKKFSAFDAIKEAAGDTATQIEKLQDALQLTIETAFGYEAAADAFASSKRSVIETIEGIEDNEDQSLGTAQDLDSNEAEALQLRGQMRDMIGNLAEDTTAWAAAQEKVTGTDIAAYLQERIGTIKTEGEQWGLNSDFIQHYIDAYQEVITSGDIVKTFAVKTDDAQGVLTAYLTTIGQIEDKSEVTTYVNLMNADVSRQQLVDNMLAMGMTPEQVLTTIKVHTEEATANLGEYLNTLASSTEDQEVIISAFVEFADGDIDQEELKARTGLEDAEIETLVNMSGDGLAQTMILTQMLDELGLMNEAPTVSVEDKASGILNNIQSKLISLNSYVARPKVIPQSSGIPQVSAGGPDHLTTRDASGSIHFADGALGGMIKEKPGNANIYQPTAKYRVFAEPETGGESYIPLHPSKRKRSRQIWQETGKHLGMYASGAVLRDRSPSAADKEKSKADREQEIRDNWRWNEAVRKNQEKAAEDQLRAAEEQKQAAEDARKAQRDKWSYKFEIEGSIGPMDQMGNLLGMMSKLPAYSDEWMEIGRSVHSLKGEMNDLRDTAQDAFYELEIVDDNQYLKFLEGRLQGVRMFSKEWWDLAMDVKRQEKKIIEGNQDLEDTIYEGGRQSLRTRVGQLLKRVAAEKVGSEEWNRLRNEALEQHWELMRRERDYGKISNEEYIKFLEDRRDAAEKYSDEWMEAQNELIQIEQDGLNKIADMYSKFDGKMVLSSKNLIRWLEHQIKLGQDWKANIEELKSSGLLDQSIIEMLVNLGPSGSGLVGAILSAQENGQGAELNNLLKLAQSLGVGIQSYDSGGYLPPGYTLAYNGTGKPERVGHDLDKATVVNLQGVAIHDRNDVSRLGQRVAFSINSARA